MSDASNVQNGGMSRRVSEVGDLLDQMAIVPPAATIDFVGKLAAEKGWDDDRAQRAYDEYLRFLLMAWVSPDMVVPSHDVDQAWHLHLTHSRHYWEVLCGEILQRPFHHEPSLGGVAEDSRHEHAYGRTLALYEHLFDEPAPSDVWPRVCRCAENARAREVVLASTPMAPIMLLGGALGVSCWAMGGEWIILVIALATIALCILASRLNAAEQEEEERRAYRERRDRIRNEGFRRVEPVEVDPAVLSAKLEEMRERTRTTSASSRVSPGSRRSDRADDRRTSGGGSYDRSGDDVNASFAMIMAASSSSSDAHSHSHSSSHSGHSCSSSSHSSHSCSSSSSHSCSSSSSSSSSSCGGSSCGSSCGSS